MKQFLKNPYTRYLLPMATLMALGSIHIGADVMGVAWWYAMRMTLVLLVFCLLFKGCWQEITGRFDWWAVLAGGGVLLVWMGYYHAFHPEITPAFSPEDIPIEWVWLALLVRTLGASIVTPLVEETVFRSFLPRFLTQNNFLAVSLNSYHLWPFWGAVAAFAIVHPFWQWPVAAFAGAIYGFYLVRTGNVWGCIIAHGTTNLGISLYAIAMNEWGLWG